MSTPKPSKSALAKKIKDCRANIAAARWARNTKQEEFWTRELRKEQRRFRQLYQ